MKRAVHTDYLSIHNDNECSDHKDPAIKSYLATKLIDVIDKRGIVHLGEFKFVTQLVLSLTSGPRSHLAETLHFIPSLFEKLLQNPNSDNKVSRPYHRWSLGLQKHLRAFVKANTKPQTATE